MILGEDLEVQKMKKEHQEGKKNVEERHTLSGILPRIVLLFVWKVPLALTETWRTYHQDFIRSQ